MAQDRNLHLRRTVSPPKDQNSDNELLNEMDARLHAFWGCYHIDQSVFPSVYNLTVYSDPTVQNFCVHFGTASQSTTLCYHRRSSTP